MFKFHSDFKFLLVMFALCFFIVGVSIVELPKTKVANKETVSAPAIQCNQDIWKYVYHPQRLKVIEKCKKIEGVLVNYVQEADGDFHGRVDIQDKTLINQDNIVGQHGYLVIEGICQGKITQKDAIQPCTGYTTPKFNLKPLLGKKIEVVGSYIQDTEHNKGAGGWLEIHPVLTITSLQ